MMRGSNAAICSFGFSLIASLFSPADAQEIDLYVDTVTKQVYTEPGKNRVKMGTFQQVQKGANRQDKKSSDRQAQKKLDQPAQKDSVQQARKDSSQQAQNEPGPAFVHEPLPERPKEEHWYDRMHIRGYTQFRNNTTVSGDKDAVVYWPDRSVGEDTSFLIRRARLIFYGDITDNLYLYFQPDFASTPSGSSTGQFGQLRDAYADISFDDKKEFRVRLGQSKIPFSFENMQSSQNRLALDRADGTNTCCRDERDIGAFFYWAPAEIRERFRDLVANNLKGSGDYGVIAFGVYNGQGANRVELNNDMHMVARVTYPYQFANGQIFEAGVEALHGRFVTSNGAVNGITPVMVAPAKGFVDERVAVHAVLYPQPFGLQAEWNWGRGPQLNDPQRLITDSPLNGGYVQATYKYDAGPWGIMFPFVKWQYYEGGQKFERNAPRNLVNDWEFGVEWQVTKAIELTAEYHMMNRTDVLNAPYNQFRADVVRVQVQWNY
jgi:hypothetical protein